MTLKHKLKVYDESDGINQSILKYIRDNGRYALEPKESKNSLAFLEGSMFDIKLFHPNEFDDFYIESNGWKMTDKNKELMEILERYNFPENDRLLIKILDEISFRKNWSEEKRLALAKETIKKNKNAFLVRKEKQAVTPELIEHIDNMVDSTKNSSVYKELFEEDTKDVLTQLPIFFEHMGVKCKALLDAVIQKENDKIYIVDAKTFTGNIENLFDNIAKFDYEFQLHWYALAVSKFFKVPLDRIYTMILGTSKTHKNYVVRVDIPLNQDTFDKINSYVDEYKTYLSTEIEYLHLYKHNNTFNYEKLKEQHQDGKLLATL